ncbi:MAG: DUF1849 family protein [Alphaproteobacteria bacterium]
MLVIVAIFAAATVSTTSATSRAAFELMPHRAIYGVTLASARSGSGIAAVTGELLADWSESCAGWSLDHRSRLDVTYAPGQAIQINVSVATWESRDGLDYRFNVSNSANGSVIDRIEGRATLVAAGQPGRVIYDMPVGRIDVLPAGTVFPTTHSVRILEAADKAPTLVAMPVFDGMTLDGTYSVSAFLGQTKAPARTLPKHLAALEGHRSWPLRMAFFPVAGHAAEPGHEIGMVMYDNGVGEDLLLEFGDFTVRARLLRLEMGDRPSCGA